MQACRYWKVVLRYGHVGRRNEVSVARFLVTETSDNAISVMDLAAEMPGVKNNGVLHVKEISFSEYINGKSEESVNVYLQKLREHSSFTA